MEATFRAPSIPGARTHAIGDLVVGLEPKLPDGQRAGTVTQIVDRTPDDGYDVTIDLNDAGTAAITHGVYDFLSLEDPTGRAVDVRPAVDVADNEAFLAPMGTDEETAKAEALGITDGDLIDRGRIEQPTGDPEAEIAALEDHLARRETAARLVDKLFVRLHPEDLQDVLDGADLVTFTRGRPVTVSLDERDRALIAARQRAGFRPDTA